jgi:hypothetical protein
MRKNVRRPKRLSARRSRSLICRAIAPEALPPNLDPEALMGTRRSLVRSLPAWVERFGLLAGPDHYCLWCKPWSSPGEIFPGQIILDIPRGRYLVEIYDAAAQRWVSRESAEGGPLVAGLPYTGNRLLVWIRAVMT